MRHPSVRFFIAAVTVTLLLTACTQAPPAQPTAVPKAAEPIKAAAPAPTAAPVAPTSAPTVPTSAPTAAPVKASDFPAKGRTINFIVSATAGGATDIAARLLGSLMEKDLGVSVQVLNRPGAGQQLGLTELATAKPDGYTIGYTNLPTAMTTYLEPERKAVFARKDFQPLGAQFQTPQVIAVKGDSPYKTLKDLIDAAKAKPGSIKAGSAGVLSCQHLNIMQLEKAGNVEFSTVHFDGGAPTVTALLGGHVDFALANVPEVMPQTKAGELRALAITTKEETKFLPGVKTAESQGYQAYGAVVFGISAPAGIPKDVLDVLSTAIKKGVANQEHTSKGDSMGYDTYYLTPDQFAGVWTESEKITIPLVELAKKK